MNKIHYLFKMFCWIYKVPLKSLPKLWSDTILSNHHQYTNKMVQLTLSRLGNRISCYCQFSTLQTKMQFTTSCRHHLSVSCSSAWSFQFLAKQPPVLEKYEWESQKGGIKKVQRNILWLANIGAYRHDK